MSTAVRLVDRVHKDRIDAGTVPAKSSLVAQGGEQFERVESMATPEPMDMSAYAYDAPWTSDDPADEPLDEAFDDASAEGGEDFDGTFALFDDPDDTSDDDLFAALDQALDEIEQEQRVEAFKAVASPEHDALELSPAPETVYRDALKNFLAQPAGQRAPRYTQVAVRTPVQCANLGSLLDDGFRRARLSVEQRKAVGKITNPRMRSALTY